MWGHFLSARFVSKQANDVRVVPVLPFAISVRKAKDATVKDKNVSLSRQGNGTFAG
jgi:hypothetical protein